MSFVIALPDQEVLHRLLDYDPETGLLTWRPRGTARFDSRFAGKPALTAPVHGYLHGKINYINYRAHRVIWKWMTGEDPIEVDHINGIRNENRWNNLRSVTRKINGRNVGMNRNNTSGLPGVIWEKRRSKWTARVQIDGRLKHLGAFDCKLEAHAARAGFLVGLGFTERHIGVGGVPSHS